MRRESDKPLAWLAGEVKTPPFSREGRIAAGLLLRRLQRGESIGLPHARPMPEIGAGGLELRIRDRGQSWRIMLRVDTDAIVIAEVFQKRTRTTPNRILRVCQERLRRYDQTLED